MLLAKISIFLLWMAAVIDPIGNMFGIRYLALGLAASALVFLFVMGRIRLLQKTHRGALIIILSGVLPVYGLGIYYMHEGDGEFIDTSYLAAGALMVTSLLYVNRSMCDFGISCLVFSTRLLSLIVISAYLSQQLPIGEWISLFTERNVALVSFREYSGITLPYIYFLASPLLILLLAYDACKLRNRANLSNLIAFASGSLSLALTGTRAHMLIAALFFPLYVLLVGDFKTILKILLLFCIVALAILFLEDVGRLIDSFFSASETNNSMKLSLVSGYAEIFSDPLVLLFGQGFNAHEWSMPLRGMIAMEDKASKTELTYLELVRVFGILIAGMVFMALFLVLRSTKKLHPDLEWVYPGLILILINSAINPYLFSVNGILPLGLIASIAQFRRRYNR